MDPDVCDRFAYPWSLSRVTGRDLDPGKHWYVVTKSLCGTLFQRATFFVDSPTKYVLCRQQI